MPSRILVGIDDSLGEPRGGLVGARAGAEHPHRRRVADRRRRRVGRRSAIATSASFEAQAEGVALRELEFARERAGSVEVTAAIAIGAPMLVLASEASAFESVVIGTHKVGTFHGHALGSRGLQLAAVSPVPTVIVAGGRVRMVAAVSRSAWVARRVGRRWSGSPCARRCASTSA